METILNIGAILAILSILIGIGVQAYQRYERHTKPHKHTAPKRNLFGGHR